MKKLMINLYFPLIISLSTLSNQGFFLIEKNTISTTKRSALVKIDERTLTDSLKKKFETLSIADFTVTDLKIISTGSYTVRGLKEMDGLPKFVLVAGILKPTPQSEIKVELWMPQENWNGRLLGTGNGGGGGNINYSSLSGGLKKGYATVNTDLGTSRGGADGAVGMPEVWKDFGYRATHLMTVTAKELIQAYYGEPQRYAYFVGCSTGGQQALMEAQRFPGDYNGIIAGAPANNRTHLHTGFLYNYKLTNENGKPLYSRSELDFISRRINTEYAVQSGGAPGDDFLTDPALIKVDFHKLFEGKLGQSDTSLSKHQVDVLRSIYKGPFNPKTLEKIYTSPPAGSENVNGGINLQQTENGANSLLYPFKWVFGKGFNVREFDFDADLDQLDRQLASILNANSPDLSLYKKSGGKIIMYTGTADPLVPYQDAVNYYESVVREQHGLKITQEFFRYYLVPGMGHCSGGPGLSMFSHDLLLDLTEWVEHNNAPGPLEATGFRCCSVDQPTRFKRPVYPYPHFPKFLGGDVNQPGSFIAQRHQRHNVAKPAKRYNYVQ